MKTNTFILIITVYSLILGLPAIFAPAYSVAYFGGDAANNYELSDITFIGGYQIAMGFLGYCAYRSPDKYFKRSLLIAIAFLTFFAIAVYLYNLNVRDMTPHKTLYIDCAIWLIMGISSLYFWNKER